MKNIFFFIDIGFSKRDYDRFDIKKLSKYYNIFIIDLTFFSNKKYIKNIEGKTFFFKNHIIVRSIKHLTSILSQTDCHYAFDYLTDYSITNIKIRKLLKNLKIKLIYFETGLVPPINRNFYENINRYFRLFLSPLTLVKKIFLIMQLRYFIYLKSKIKYDYIILSGLAGLNTTKAIKSKKKIFLHSLDYEKYLNFKQSKITKKKYFVFIDQYLPYHPSKFFRKEKSQVTEKNYFPKLNLFFEQIEKSYGIEIIIAAHPRANINRYNTLFKRRKIIKFKTIELVKNSLGVLTHTSTAISFAILYKKPIIFLTSNEIIRSYDDYRVHSYSRLLNCRLFNISNFKKNTKIKKINNLFKIDKKRYQMYLNNYVKHPDSESNSIVDIFKTKFK